MKLPFTGLSSIQKFFISLSVIFVIVLVDYQSFLGKSRKIELYDDLNYRLSSVRVSIVKLEYILDMFVVARRFEDTTVDLIKNDVEKLDENINGVLAQPRYRELISDNPLLAKDLASMSDDWQTIRTEVKRLNTAMPQDEMILLHNAVDVNTVLVTEKADRLLGIINESRKSVFADSKEQALETVVGFIILTLIASLIIHKKILSPIYKAKATARLVSGGNFQARFSENALSAAGALSIELNRMLNSLCESIAVKERKGQDIAGESMKKTSQIEALNLLLALGGRSLSLSDLYASAVKESMQAGGADAAAVFLNEDEALRLKSSAGFDDNLVKECSVMPADALAGIEKAGAVRQFDNVEDYPYKRYAELLKSAGFKSLSCIPISYNKETAGFLYVASKNNAPSPGDTSFFEAVASGAGVLSGHVNLIQQEHHSKKFLERIVNQMPFGVAVFDKSGTCLMLNTALKKLLGTDPKYNPVGEYSLFEDAVFAAEGIIASIRKSYEGYAAEFIINYNPALLSKYFFSGPQRRLRVKSLPLYDAGGEISNIVLLYEDLSDLKEIPVGEINEKGIQHP